MKHIFYDLNKNNFTLDSYKDYYQECLTTGEDFSFILDSSGTDNVVENIEKFKEQFPYVKIHQVVLKYEEQDYISDENEINQIVNINNYLEQNNIESHIILKNSLTNGNIKNFLIAKNEIDTFTNKLNSFTYNENGKQVPLSPFEKFMVIYKYASNRVYNASKDFGDDRMRNWIGVLTSDKVICSGFASLLKCLCDQVFSPEELKCYSQGSDVLDKDDKFLGSHANNLVIINDPKYNLNGLYYADACWDCKKDRNNMEGSFDYCLIPITQIMKDKKFNFSFHKLFIYDSINPHQNQEKYDFGHIEPVIEDLLKIHNLKTKEELQSNVEVELDNLEKQYNEEVELANKISNQILEDIFKDQELSSNDIKYPAFIPQSAIEKFPELYEIDNFFNNLTLENINKEKVSEMIKSYVDFCNNNPSFIQVLEQKEKEADIKILSPLKNILSQKLSHVKYFSRYSEKDKLLKEIDKEYEQEKDKLITVHKDFVYSKEIPEEVYAKGFKALGLYGGFSEDKTDRFVQHEIEKRRLGKETCFNLKENETIK